MFLTQEEMQLIAERRLEGYLSRVRDIINPMTNREVYSPEGKSYHVRYAKSAEDFEQWIRMVQDCLQQVSELEIPEYPIGGASEDE